MFARGAGVCTPSLSRRPRSTKRGHRGKGTLQLMRKIHKLSILFFKKPPWKEKLLYLHRQFSRCKTLGFDIFMTYWAWRSCSLIVKSGKQYLEVRISRRKVHAIGVDFIRPLFTSRYFQTPTIKISGKRKDSCLFYALISNKFIQLFMTGMPKTVAKSRLYNLNLMCQQEKRW